LKKRLARLCVETRRAARLVEPAEEIDFVREIARDGKEIALAARGVDERTALAIEGRARAELRGQAGMGDADERASLRQARGGEVDARVLRVCARDESVEDRIGERFPPFAARLRRGGCGGARAGVAFLECLRSRGKVRTLERRCRAACECGGQREKSGNSSNRR
jgi:hypothetical protein